MLRVLATSQRQAFPHRIGGNNNGTQGISAPPLRHHDRCLRGLPAGVGSSASRMVLYRSDWACSANSDCTSAHRYRVATGLGSTVVLRRYEPGFDPVCEAQRRPVVDTWVYGGPPSACNGLAEEKDRNRAAFGIGFRVTRLVPRQNSIRAQHPVFSVI